MKKATKCGFLRGFQPLKPTCFHAAHWTHLGVAGGAMLCAVWVLDWPEQVLHAACGLNQLGQGPHVVQVPEQEQEWVELSAAWVPSPAFAADPACPTCCMWIHSRPMDCSKVCILGFCGLDWPTNCIFDTPALAYENPELLLG